MRYWPVPDSYSKNIPLHGSSGSFWENRGDRYHCGVDIYAPPGSKVIAIECGEVIDLGVVVRSNALILIFQHETSRGIY